MKLWDRLRERRAARREEHEREAQQDLEARKRTIRDEYTEEGFPSAGAGYLPAP